MFSTRRFLVFVRLQISAKGIEKRSFHVETAKGISTSIWKRLIFNYDENEFQIQTISKTTENFALLNFIRNLFFCMFSQWLKHYWILFIYLFFCLLSLLSYGIISNCYSNRSKTEVFRNKNEILQKSNIWSDMTMFDWRKMEKN